MQQLVPDQGQTCAPKLGAQDYWTTREVPPFFFSERLFDYSVNKRP